MKSKVLRVAIGIMLGVLLMASSSWASLHFLGDGDALLKELAVKRGEVNSLYNQYWALEDSIWQIRISHRAEVKQLEAKARVAEQQAWVLENKLDNLKRLVDAARQEAAIQIDAIEDQYEQEIYDLYIATSKKDREITSLNEENRLLRNQLRMAVMSYDPAGLKNFKDMNELLAFLAGIRINEIVYDDEGFMSGNYMFLLMRLAATAGYAIYPAALYSVEGNHIVEAHGMNIAVIEQGFMGGQAADFVVVGIEPQTLEVLIVGRLPIPDNWREVIFPFVP